MQMLRDHPFITSSRMRLKQIQIVHLRCSQIPHGRIVLILKKIMEHIIYLSRVPYDTIRIVPASYSSRQIDLGLIEMGATAVSISTN